MSWCPVKPKRANPTSALSSGSGEINLVINPVTFFILGGYAYISYVINQTSLMIRSSVNPLTFPQLFTAGRAVLTLHNPESGNHVTIRSKQWKKRNAEGKLEKLPNFSISISLLGDKEQGMLPAGYFFQEENRWAFAKEVDRKSQLGRVFSLIQQFYNDPMTIRQKGVSVLHEGKCCRCALPLTNPQSIERGLGDDCHAYTFGTENQKKREKLGLV